MWALGVLLYELAALRPPFDARSLHELGERIKRGERGSSYTIAVAVAAMPEPAGAAIPAGPWRRAVVGCASRDVRRELPAPPNPLARRTAGAYAPIPATYSADLSEVIRQLLTVAPQRRPTAQQLLALPLLTRKRAELAKSMGAAVVAVSVGGAPALTGRC
jgi:serine/threonine protein kinase